MEGHFAFPEEKALQRTFATKISPNFRVNFLVRFASKPMFCWVMTGSPLKLFRKFFGAVRTIFWLWGSSWAPYKHFRSRIRNKSGNTPETLSEQILNLQVPYNLRPPNPGRWSIFPTPSAVGALSFFGGAPANGPARAGHGILDSTGGTSEKMIAKEQNSRSLHNDNTIS